MLVHTHPERVFPTVGVTQLEKVAQNLSPPLAELADGSMFTLEGIWSPVWMVTHLGIAPNFPLASQPQSVLADPALSGLIPQAREQGNTETKEKGTCTLRWTLVACGMCSLQVTFTVLSGTVWLITLAELSVRQLGRFGVFRCYCIIQECPGNFHQKPEWYKNRD